MDHIIEKFYREGTLPDDTDKEKLCDHLLATLFPSLREENTINVLDKGSVTLKNISPIPIGEYGCDYSVVEAARVSLGRGIDTTIRDEKLVSFLWNHKHMSPFEHITISIRVKCPIPIARHFMRHRTFSYNEESARYAEVKDEFYLPTMLRKQSPSNRQCSVDESISNSDEIVDEMGQLYESAYNLYRKMLLSGVAKEQARFVLPQGMYTSFIMTGNLRNWIHFLELRTSSDAQWEIVQYANAISNLILPYLPMTRKALKK